MPKLLMVMPKMARKERNIIETGNAKYRFITRISDKGEPIRFWNAYRAPSNILAAKPPRYLRRSPK